MKTIWNVATKQPKVLDHCDAREHLTLHPNDWTDKDPNVVPEKKLSKKEQAALEKAQAEQAATEAQALADAIEAAKALLDEYGVEYAPDASLEHYQQLAVDNGISV